VRSLLRQLLFEQRRGVQGGRETQRWREKARRRPALDASLSCNSAWADEPTTTVDIPAKQMLEDALREYEGAALLVSHDRYFISAGGPTGFRRENPPATAEAGGSTAAITPITRPRRPEEADTEPGAATASAAGGQKERQR